MTTATRQVAPRAQVAAVKAAHAAQITVDNYAEFVTTFAFETCYRCGGTGRMPFAAYGGVCFKCNGQGQHLTPAGRKAFAALEAKRDEVYGTTWAEVSVGDVVFWEDSRTWRAVLTMVPSSTKLTVGGVPVTCYDVTRAKKPDTTYVKQATSAARKHSVPGAVAVMQLAATLSGVQVTRKAAS